MDRDRLVLALAAVFAGLTTLLVVLAFVEQLFLLILAIPFGVTTYFMWYHASGRMEERARTRRVQGGQRTRRERFGGDPQSRFGGDPRSRFGPGPGAGARQGGTAGRSPQPSGISQTEAYETLGLDPGADDDAVRTAYRERVKEVHPDTPSGDEDEFKRVNKAYERLTDEAA